MQKFFNPSAKQWEGEAFMVKERSATVGKFLATCIIVPAKSKKDEDIFVTTGVRIEDTSLRTVKVHNGVSYTLPGQAYFYSYRTKKISQTRAPKFITNKVGGLVLERQAPLVEDGEKQAGKAPETHRMGERLMAAVKAAEIAFQLDRMAKFNG